MTNIIVTGSYFVLQSPAIRFLEEVAKLGKVHVLLTPDEAETVLPQGAVKLPLEERLYLLANLRYVSSVNIADHSLGRDELPLRDGARPDLWAVEERDDREARRAFCRRNGIRYQVIRDGDRRGFPLAEGLPPQSGKKRVVVTGCFDWLHSGHVRFFEEASGYGDLFVVVGSDRNLRLLKGDGHPLFSQDERRYMVQSVRFVTRALISSGEGWMDAEPEIDRIRPDIYLVNEDGDQPEKREFCVQHGLQYVILKREPKPGLPRRRSTDLRGF